MEYWRQVCVDSFAYFNKILQKSCQHYLKIDVVADVATKLSKIFFMIRMSKKKIYNLSFHQISVSNEYRYKSKNSLNRVLT